MVKMLDFPDWRILKEINIVSKTNYDQEIVIGTILYERNISKDYYLKDDTEPNAFLRLLNYPKQDLFPTDLLDEIIFNAIKEKFPKSFVKNYEIAFSSDIEMINRIQTKPFELATLEIRPNFSQIDLNLLVGKSFNFPQKEIKIYQDFTKESIKGHYFMGICNYENHSETFDKLNKIDFK